MRSSETLDQLCETQAAIDRDMREAQRLQQGLVRESHGRFGGFDLSLLMRRQTISAAILSGSFRSMPAASGCSPWTFQGHGIASALLSARLAALLSGATDHNIALRITELGLYDARPPLEILRELNALMINELRIDSYFTMVYADLDFLSGDVRLVQAAPLSGAATRRWPDRADRPWRPACRRFRQAPNMRRCS